MSTEETFKIVLEEKYFFSKSDVLVTHDGVELIVISEPKCIDPWWKKILRVLTFGKYFQKEYIYPVELETKIR